MSPTVSGTSILLYVIAGAVFCLGVFLLILAWYGRRIDNHPWCRRCGFDLFGRDKKSDTPCPECGSDLRKPKAVRIGQRRKRKGMAILASLVLLLGTSGLGVMGYSDAAGVDWQRHKPVWWLMREANGSPGLTSDDAITELRRRYETGALDADQVDRLIEAALRHHGDQARAWQPAWADLIWDDYQSPARRVSDSQLKRFFEQMIVEPVRIEVRSRVVHGSEYITIAERRNALRIPNNFDYDYDYWLRYRSKELILGSVPMRAGGSSGGSLSGGGASYSHRPVSEAFWQELPPGKHMARYTYEVELEDRSTESGDAGGPTLLAQSEVVVETEFEVLPSGSSTVTVHTDPSLKQQVEDAVRLEGVSMHSYHFEEDQPRLEIRFKINPRPLDIVFLISIMHDGQEHEISALEEPADGSTHLHTGGKIPMDLAGETIDIILRPSAKRAEESLACYEIWGEAIVYEDVVVGQER